MDFLRLRKAQQKYGKFLRNFFLSEYKDNSAYHSTEIRIWFSVTINFLQK